MDPANHCHDCRQMAQLERELASQRKENELKEFLACLKIKEDQAMVKATSGRVAVSTWQVSPQEEVIKQQPRFAEAASSGPCSVANFEKRILDCGGGKSYMYAPLLPPTDGLVRAMVLSAWDNIVGPKAVFVWMAKDDEKATGPFKVEEAVRYTVGHTLHGELGKLGSKVSAARGHELYVAEDTGFLVCSVPFSAPPEGEESVPHSLAVILPSTHMKRYLELQPLFNLWMQRLACCMKVFLYRKDYKMALIELSPTVVEFCQVLGSLASAGLTTKYLQFQDEIDIDLERRALKPILEKAVTSHLQTCCCSLVIGDSAAEVNCVVRVLANFLRPKERALVRLACEGKNAWPYHPGLHIQGIVKGAGGEAGVTAEDVLCNTYPTTIVDLSRNKVVRSWLFHEHVKRRKARFKQQFASLLTGSSSCPAMTQNMFHRVSHVSPLVHNFMEKVWSLECDLQRRSGLVTLFLRQLEYHAFALINLLQASWNGDSDSVTSDAFKPVNQKSLRKQLDLEDESDFLVILAVAEKLHPGVYSSVMSESDSGD